MISKTARWAILTVVAAVFVASAVFGRRLYLEEDLTALLPHSDPVIQSHLFLLDRFKTLDKVYIDVGLEDGAALADGGEEAIVRVADDLWERLAESGLFEQIVYRTTLEEYEDFLGILGRGRPFLATAEDLDAIEARLTPEAVAERLEALRRDLLGPSGVFLRERSSRDPLGLDQFLTAKFEGLGQGTAEVYARGSRLWSRDRRHVLMVAEPGFPASDTGRAEALVRGLETIRNACFEAMGQPQVAIRFTSGHISTLDNATTIRADINRALLAISVMIALVGMLVFRRKIYAVLVFLPAAFGVATAVVVFGAFAPGVSAVALGCGAALIGITVDYGIHVLFRMDRPGSAALSPFECVRGMALPLAMGAGTTSAAFLCLHFSALPGQRQMGYVAAIGVLSAVLFTGFALPCLVPAASGRASKALPLAAYMARFSEWRDRHMRALLLAGLAMLLACGYGLSLVTFEGDVTKLSFLSPRNQEDETKLLDVWGRFSPTLVSVQGNTLNEALANNDKLFDVLSRLKSQGSIRSFASISPLLPAPDRQRRNQARWNAFWPPARRVALERLLAEAGGTLGFTSDAFDPFFSALETAPDLMTLDDLGDASLGQLVRAHVAEEDGEYSVLTRLVLAESTTFEDVAAVIQGQVPRAVVGDRRHFARHIAELVFSGLSRLAVVTSCAVMVCLLIALGSIELAVATFLPVLLSVVATLGILGLLGIPINMISCIFIAFVFGVGVDFAIFSLNSALESYRTGKDHQSETAASVCVCALTTLCGFGALALAKHPAFFAIGFTGLVGIMSSLIISLVLVPALVKFLIPFGGQYGAPTAKHLAGGLLVIAFLAGALVLYGFVLRPLVYLWRRGDSSGRGRFARAYLHGIGVAVVRYFPYRASERIHVGFDSRTFEKPAIIVANHASGLDIMAVLAFTREIIMVVNTYNWNLPLIGGLLKDAECVLAGEGDVDAFMAQCQDRLSRGISVVIFPEGTRSRDATIRRFHSGAFELARRTKCDVLPVLITDAQACLAPKAYWIGDHCTLIHVLDRITPETWDYDRGAKDFAKHVKGLLLDQLDADWRVAQGRKAFPHIIRSLYTYLAPHLRTRIWWRYRTDPLCRTIDALVPDTGTIVDFGCGIGLLSNVLARKSLSRHVVGLEWEERKLHIAQRTVRHRKNIAFEKLDGLGADPPAADALLLIDAVARRPEGQLDALVHRACAWLRPGGTLLFRARTRSREQTRLCEGVLDMMTANGMTLLPDEGPPEGKYGKLFILKKGG